MWASARGIFTAPVSEPGSYLRYLSEIFRYIKTQTHTFKTHIWFVGVGAGVGGTTLSLRSPLHVALSWALVSETGLLVFPYFVPNPFNQI